MHWVQGVIQYVRYNKRYDTPHFKYLEQAIRGLLEEPLPTPVRRDDLGTLQYGTF
jgi:hypothetical protein